MNYAIEMASGGMIYIPNFMMTGSDIQVVLRLLPIQFERLQCWEACMKYAVEIASGGTISIPSFIKISSGLQTLLGDETHIDTQTPK
jgi:hypothetical protein